MSHAFCFVLFCLCNILPQWKRDAHACIRRSRPSRSLKEKKEENSTVMSDEALLNGHGFSRPNDPRKPRWLKPGPAQYAMFTQTRTRTQHKTNEALEFYSSHSNTPFLHSTGPSEKERRAAAHKNQCLTFFIRLASSIIINQHQHHHHHHDHPVAIPYSRTTSTCRHHDE